MTEFKQGDKVTHADSFFSGVYTLVEKLAADGTIWRVKQDGREHRGWTFHAKNLTKVEEPGPKVGDRVRLVHEGVVTSITRGTVYLDGKSRVLGQGETVEILERAPKVYAPGTLVRGFSGSLAARTEAGYWVWLSDGKTSGVITDKDVRKDRIVYEPPQSA